MASYVQNRKVYFTDVNYRSSLVGLFRYPNVKVISQSISQRSFFVVSVTERSDTETKSRNLGSRYVVFRGLQICDNTADLRQ